MPQLNGTGPSGQGPGTGQGKGNCQKTGKRNDASSAGGRRGTGRKRRGLKACFGFKSVNNK